MHKWRKQIQIAVDEIDTCIKNYNDETLTLYNLSKKLGYSKSYTTRKFKQISGMQFRDYLRQRKLAFALKEVRDTEKKLLDIAVNYGFSSHEAFTRAFKKSYGITPSEYRKNPKPVVLRIKINTLCIDSLRLGKDNEKETTNEVKTYFVTIPAHKFLHIKNEESNGYWDFWEKQSHIPEQDCETICGIFDSIKGKLDDIGGSEANSGSGQLMAYINNPNGRLCDWGFPRTECYGVRLPFDYEGEVPSQMLMIDIPEAEYIVFEHAAFDYEQENKSVEEKIEKTMADFDFADTGYNFDTSPGRIIYMYHNPECFLKYVRPIQKISLDKLSSVGGKL
ncbi:MAG: helix-turn-helix transcriptional regulator [Coprobacillaceae bacterium]